MTEKRKRMLELKTVNDRFAELNLYYKALTKLVKDFIALVQSRETVFYKEVTSEQVYSLLLSKLVVDRYRDISSEMTFAKIPVGSIMMESPTTIYSNPWDNEKRQHEVTFNEAFEMQVTEVTQEQWFKVMGGNPSYFSEEKYCPETYMEVGSTSLCPIHPVEQVSWNDVQMFIQRLSKQDSSYHYRLPTEAEWEYSARAGATGPYSLEGSLEIFAWYKKNSKGQSHPVGQLTPNGFGLYDVQGNVHEWISDRGSSSDPTRILRSCSWGSNVEHCSLAHSDRSIPDDRFKGIGFRLVRKPK